MSNPTYYAGPGQIFFNGITIQPNEVAGSIASKVTEKTTKRGNATTGEGYETYDDAMVSTTIAPWDRWALLSTAFPTWLGVTTSPGSGSWSAGGTGALSIGTNLFDPANSGTNSPLDVWTPDGRLYQTVRAAVTKFPGMKFGNGQPLFEQLEITSIGNPSLVPGASGFLFTGNAITESGAVNPDTAGFPSPDFLSGRWLATWTGISGFASFECEDFFSLVPDVRVQFHTVQKLTRLAKLTSARFMIKCRPVGPTVTQILGKIGAHTLGGLLNESANTSLVLTGPAGLSGGSAKTVTLAVAEILGANQEFGGTRLNNGEIGFVSTQVITGGVVQPQLIFSA